MPPLAQVQSKCGTATFFATRDVANNLEHRANLVLDQLFTGIATVYSSFISPVEIESQLSLFDLSKIQLATI
jgi:hypothetical protein